MRRMTGLTIALAAVAAGVLTQAILAGGFLGGAGGARIGHAFVGFLLPCVALVPAVLAFVERGRRDVPGWAVIGAAALPVLLWIQNTLGHLPFAPATAIHVPLGVSLFGLSVALTIVSARATERTGTDVGR
ncbi:hypothetical protein [Egicoccus sp. AB-alg2]|uniref:hypothetical protein n=1 Tax=Egicoccus sp. AB-alg2 TaxID=3242693 RepID=UPI00359E51D1